MRDLEYIVAVGKHGSFSYAAALCHVSQPSLSTQVKKVEAELGVSLFKRSRRSVEVTAYGSRFIERAEQILALLEEVRDMADEAVDMIKGKITVGGILTVAPYLFSYVVKSVKKHAPNIDLVLKEATTGNLVKGMLTREIDMAIISLPTDDNVFESVSLFEEPFYLAVADAHPLAAKEIIDDQALKGQDLILLDEGHCFRKQALDICHSTTARENALLSATSLETVRHFVSTETGITLIPQMAIKQNDGITYLPLANQHFKREIGVIWQKSSPKRSLIARMIEVLQEASVLLQQSLVHDVVPQGSSNT
ncbi:MAG: LysR substrate-binding domain-containing protein [Bacteroidota bacterium]